MAQPMVIGDPDRVVGLKQTEEMPALAAKEMSSVAFHRFPNLPAELRLKVWKAACFPCTANHRGIHYIDLATIGDGSLSKFQIRDNVPMEMRALHPDCQTSPNAQGPVGRANRSAYMWDAGLWRACKESREVISMHFQLRIWRRTQDKQIDPLELDEGLSRACQPYLSKVALEFFSSDEEEVVYGKRPGHKGPVHACEPFLPTCLLFSNKEHVERFMVMPTRDLFFVKNLSGKQLPVSLEEPLLHVPCPNGQKIVLRHSFNLVLGFDTSWNDDFPVGWNELKKEESPRGLFATWANNCRCGVGDAPRIYLLNKAARWGPGWSVNEDTVFHDCDGAYVEVKNKYYSSYPAQPAETSAMLQFLQSVWDLWKIWDIASC
ncbi:hypothetical protein H9Q73_003883 [Fusarium xylarioides]|nr:hypothetical protein H9Q73_003883 [Fusarium xylarioides]